MVLVYTVSFLKSFSTRLHARCCPGLWRRLTDHGLTRVKPTRRGCRGGRPRFCGLYRQFENQFFAECVNSSVCDAVSRNLVDVANLHNASRKALNIQVDSLTELFDPPGDIPVSYSARGRCQNNLITIKRTPLPRHIQQSNLMLCHANVRSAKSKSADLLDFIYSNDIDLFAITETWVADIDTAAMLEFTPDTHNFYYHNRSGRRGGGTGLLAKKNITVKKIDAGEKKSFEFSQLNIHHDNFRMRLLIIYRPQYSADHPVTINTFLQEFAEYLESIILSPEPVIIVGDFNIHVDVKDDPDAMKFADLLSSLGLNQLVSEPTHIHGHTLDLVISRKFDTVIEDSPIIGRYLSDHAAVFCCLNQIKPTASVKQISYRKIKSLDVDILREDLMKTELCNRSFTDLDELSSLYNTTLKSLLDLHAPLITKMVVSRKRLPWFNNEIKTSLRARRKAERRWRATKSALDFGTFKLMRNRTTYLMNIARREYYANHIAENGNDQRKLFQTTASLLSVPKQANFPANIDPKALAEDFGRFFVRKIEDINCRLDGMSHSQSSTIVDTCRPADTDISLNDFKQLTTDDVSNLISKAGKKSCILDPMPSSLIVSLLDVLLPVVTDMLNLSFSSSHFPDAWKEALVIPTLKKPGLDNSFKNFRPVSNLPYISKLSERAAVTQITEYMKDNDLQSTLQSAYKANHSTESALLKVKNDILLNMNNQHVTLLILLDLSAAFDTINHDILIDCLKYDLGIGNNALTWLKSYLSGRSQRIFVEGASSTSLPLQYGVPQGSCLGPLLFTIYTRKLFSIVREHLPQVHCYADDTQLYLSFHPNSNTNAEAALSAMSDCISDIRSWMISDRLLINDDKTEFLLIGTKQQLSKVNIDSIHVGSDIISPSSEVRNLGAWFDSQLTMTTHISKICASSYYHLHNIRRIRKYLTVDNTKALVHALVTSRVDYCNSLLYGLPDNTLQKLQRVLNTAARLVYQENKYCHITPLLQELHWLPVRMRVHFKILLLTFKAIYGLAPMYLQDLVELHSSKYSLRSTDSILLKAPAIKTKITLGDRSFAMAAPKLWNGLPRYLRDIDSLESFKKKLKTYLFQLAFRHN